jgi:NAD-dependent dihydropyrimidine dehydrogenase PreA subunit
MPPVIDQDSCTSCGTCVDVCSEDVFFRTKEEGKPLDEQPMVTHPEFCYHCYLCVKECPSEAIWLRTPMAMTVPYK